MKTLQDKFFESVFRDDVSTVEAALSGGMNPNESHAVSGTTPLQVACQGNAVGVVSVLLAAGADPNTRFTDVSFVTGARKEDRVALMYATSPDIVRLLADAGADVDAVDGEGWSALSLSARDGSVEVVRELIGRGASQRLQGKVLAKYESLHSLIEEQLGHLKMLARKGRNEKLEALIQEQLKIQELLGI